MHKHFKPKPNSKTTTKAVQMQINKTDKAAQVKKDDEQNFKKPRRSLRRQHQKEKKLEKAHQHS